MRNLSYFTSCVTLFVVLIQWGCNPKRPDSNAKNPIDRLALVSRHNVQLNEIDPFSPLSVGNGDFAYTADVTGMQSLEDYYLKNGIPLETRSTWAWHSFPNTKNLKLEDAMKKIDFHGRPISYASLQDSPAGEYYRVNPHPVPLGQIGLTDGNSQPLAPSMINHINQKLDLWNGLITSQYTINNEQVTVETASHPELNLVAFKIKSNLLKSGKLKPVFRFPYSYDLSIKNKPPFDWSKPDQHQSAVIAEDANNILLKRTIDTCQYYVGIHWKGTGKWEEIKKHEFSLNCTGSDSIILVC